MGLVHLDDAQWIVVLDSEHKSEICKKDTVIFEGGGEKSVSHVNMSHLFSAFVRNTFPTEGWQTQSKQESVMKAFEDVSRKMPVYRDVCVI